MADQQCAVPLVELLRFVPLDAVLHIDTPNALGCMDTRHIPVGRFCHEAADALGAKEAVVPMSEVLRMRNALDALYNMDEGMRAAVIQVYGLHHHPAVAALTSGEKACERCGTRDLCAKLGCASAAMDREAADASGVSASESQTSPGIPASSALDSGASPVNGEATPASSEPDEKTSAGLSRLNGGQE